MLSFFRRGGIAQVIVAGIVFAIIVVFVLEFRAGRGATGPLQAECAVEYAGYCASPKEFFANFNLVFGGRNITPKLIREWGGRAAILQGLAERELLVHEAERLGLAVSEDDINRHLQAGRVHISLPAAEEVVLSNRLGLCVADGRSCAIGTTGLRPLPVQKNGAFNYAQYERSVRVYANRSPKEFKDMQDREIVASRLRALVRSRAHVSESEAFSIFERERSQATVRIVQARKNWFAKYAVNLSKIEIDDLAAKNKSVVDEAWEREKSRFVAGCPLVREIVVEFGADATDEDKALRRTEIEEAKRRLARGEDFGELARELSDAPSAAWSGEIGCLSDQYGLGAETLLEAVGKLKDGATTDIVETVRGFYLMRREDTLEAGQEEPVGRRVLARRVAIGARANELAEAFARELIQAVSKGEKLDDATLALVKRYANVPESDDSSAALGDDDRPKVIIGTPFNIAQNPISNALPSEHPAVDAFALKKADAVHKDPIKTTEGFAVMQLKELDLAKREDFEKDKAELLESLRDSKAQDALIRYVAQLRKAAGDALRVNQAFAEAPKSDDNPGEG